MGYNLGKARKEISTPRKSSSYRLCEDIVKEIVQIRQFDNISQNELADMSGFRQPMIALIEHGINTPNRGTVLKLLAAFDKTLYIGDLESAELEDSANRRQDECKTDRSSGR